MGSGMKPEPRAVSPNSTSSSSGPCCRGWALPSPRSGHLGYAGNARSGLGAEGKTVRAKPPGVGRPLGCWSAREDGDDSERTTRQSCAGSHCRGERKDTGRRGSLQGRLGTQEADQGRWTSATQDVKQEIHRPHPQAR